MKVSKHIGRIQLETNEVDPDQVHDQFSDQVEQIKDEAQTLADKAAELQQTAARLRRARDCLTEITSLR